MQGFVRAFALTAFALFAAQVGACRGEASTVEQPQAGSAGTGGTGPNLGSLEGGAATELGGNGGALVGPGVDECETFDGLDECGVTSVEASFSAANVLLVIDKSSSMDDQPVGFELKKWDALKTALQPALEAVAEEMSFGLLLYPYGKDAEIPLDCFEGCCEVPANDAAIRVGIEPGTSSVQAVMAALDEVGPGGGTPTAGALAAALDYFTVGAGKDLKGDRFVLLATDGGPNCDPDNTCDAEHCTPNLDGSCPEGNCCEGEGQFCLDDAAVVEQLEALSAAGVPTFVIGIPGTEQYGEYLSSFATAGGVPSPNAPPDYYAVSAEGGVEALASTFVDITTHLVRSCEVELGEAPRDKRLVNVAVDCEVVPFEDGAGWDIPEETPATLVLSGGACKQLERQGARRIDVVYGCPTVK
jgi:hypothetical protein